MGHLDDKSIFLKNSVIVGFDDTNILRNEMHYFKDENSVYKPKYNFDEYYSNFLSRTDDKVLLDVVRHLNIEYIDETWQKSDWIVVFIAGTVGILLDILITQTKILKPIDKKISEFMKSEQVTNFKDFLDKFSSSFRNGNSAPIDFQDFKMHGLKSIHEQYSFGHDPLRFIEGIMQIMSGDYRGVDKLGNIVTAKFGEGIPNVFHAVISYVAHMVSDFCNANSLPYPGTTLLMQFGSQETRDSIAAAYRGQLYNSRTFVYQSLPTLVMSIIIHCWGVYDNYTGSFTV